MDEICHCHRVGFWGFGEHLPSYVALVCGIAFFDASTPENLAMFLLSGCAALFSFALIAVLELLRKKQQTSPK